MKEIRLAMIGCGAVAEQAHLPAGRELTAGRFSLLVDKSKTRRDQLSKAFGIPLTAEDWTEARDDFDAAIVALPHHLHEPVCCALLNAGKHVLVEKPLARTLREGTAMVMAAEKSGTCLAVGLMRRFGWAAQMVRRLIASGATGRINSFNFEEGGIYNWPVASDFFFRRETAGGGVLIDTGAHTLDLLLWWLGDFSQVLYSDDSAGGVEADCRLELRLQSGASGTVELSRLRAMRNTAILQGENLTIEVSMHTNRLSVRATGMNYDLTTEVLNSISPGSQYFPQLISSQLRQFVDAIHHGTPPHVPGSAALPSMRLIEECYQHRQPLAQPWSTVPAGYPT